MKIDYANLGRQTDRYRAELDAAIKQVIDDSAFILGPYVSDFEQQLVEYVGTKHAIGCGSGTDALLLSMLALGVGAGDEVITSPFTFFASAETIAHLGATPVFVDIEPRTYNIDTQQLATAITSRTKAIMPVSLYGQPADMSAINDIAAAHGLPVIEDAAQSFGATYDGKRSGALSTLAATSFFPAKPLGCFGDGGAVFTDNDELAEKIRSLRVHGQTGRYYHEHIGMGARLDAVQAAVLSVKLKHYGYDLHQRQAIANHYSQLLSQLPDLVLPQLVAGRTSAWAQYTIAVEQRESLQHALKTRGVPTAVHYPRPMHLQPCFANNPGKLGDFPVAERASQRVLSLPLGPDLTFDEVHYVVGQIEEILAEQTVAA